MTVDEVIEAARAQTGLSELGDPSILDGVAMLLKSYSEEAKFTERGAQMAHADLVKWMSVRLRVEDWLARNPALLDQPIENPMFVFGLPRTGTTLVINLLASDPARRSFLRWESHDPVPPARPDELHDGPRWQKMHDQTKVALQYMPQIAAIHFEEADSPTECQFLMTPSFCSQVYESQADIPTYREWFLHEADYLPAFRFHKRYLQMLQAEAGGRWTLKNPWHPLYLPALKEVYPDAQLVMTHRDPADVLGSIGSLIENVRQIYSADVDLEAIGRQFVETFQIMIERQDAFRAEHGQDAIFDVQYADVMKDPIGQVRAIYEHFGEPITAEAAAAMEAYMAANPKGKHGKHDYSLERYGLSRKGVHAAFADYIDRYRIPVKR